MIISHEYKFIFAHIGRTAGTSVEDSLLQALQCPHPTQAKGERHELILDSLYDGRETLNPNLRHLNGKKHATLEDLKELAGAKNFKRYFKFATVRNPWDHELSKYTKHISKTTGAKLNKGNFSKVSFDKHLMKRLLLHKRRGSTFFDFLAVDGRVEIDALIYFERLEQDFQMVCSEIGLEAKLQHNGDESRHRNKDTLYGYRQYYSTLGKTIVGRLRNTDSAWLGYQF
jgi:hypothetical protein